MADKKTELMAQFYEECQKKGYTDMHNDTQSLKAKVIATDLKLNYGNIAAFYEKAENCYTQVQEEKAEAQKQRKIQQQKEAEERTRRAVNGKLLVILSDRLCEGDDATSVRVYIRPDGSIYSTVNNGSKIEGAPTLSVKKGGALLLTYHPSQAVYTGATVGGVTTGGVHYTQSGYTTSKTHSGKGDIEISINRQTFTLRLASMSDYTCSLFQRDEAFRWWVTDKQVKCFVSSAKADFYYEAIQTGRLDTQTMMNTLSMAAEEQRLSYAACEGITNLLGRIVHGQFPPSDEQIYNSAKALENATTSAELNRAIELYNSISDYKDAAKRAQAAKAKYDDVLQMEKERAVLEKEAIKKRNKKLAVIFAAVSAILSIVAIVFSVAFSMQKKSNAYDDAIAHMNAGQYAEAIDVFAALGDYKDSAEQIKFAQAAKEEADRITELDTMYNQALSSLEAGEYEKAYANFKLLGDYKDAKAYRDCFKYILKEKVGEWAVTTLFYDEFGRVIREDTKGKTDPIHNKEKTYTYNDTDGSLEIVYTYVESRSQGKYKTITETAIFNADRTEANYTITRNYDEGDTNKYTRYFTYDEYGNVLTAKSVDAETGELEYNRKYIYEYDTAGNLIISNGMVESEDGQWSKMWNTHEFSYNEDGLLSSVSYIYGDIQEYMYTFVYCPSK